VTKERWEDSTFPLCDTSSSVSP